MDINPILKILLKAAGRVPVDMRYCYKLWRGMDKLSAALQGKPRGFVLHDCEIMNGGHAVPVRFYTHRDYAPQYLLLFFHGSGWIAGSIGNQCQQVKGKISNLTSD